MDYSLVIDGPTRGIGMGLIGGLLALIPLIAIYGILCYIFKSVGYYHMAKQRGIEHAWMSWIPVLDGYVLGELINGELNFGGGLVLKGAGFWLMVTTAAGLIMHDPFFVFLASVVQIVALFRLFVLYDPKHRISFSIFSYLIRPGFFVFAIREKEPFDPLHPNKTYKHFYEEEKEIRDAQKSADEKIDQRLTEMTEQIHQEYDERIEKAATDEEKEALRKQKDHELDSLASRAAQAKLENEKTAKEFKKMAKEMPTDQEFTQAVENEAQQANPDVYATEEIFIEEDR